MTAVVSADASSRWVFIAAAVISVVSMSLTAVWFWILGGAVLLVTVAIGLASGRLSRSGVAAGTGILVGPSIYFALALLT
jgi:hypothetical protein